MGLLTVKLRTKLYKVVLFELEYNGHNFSSVGPI